ncbi:hypothetical protein [uncultured Corynebacterium sp.]|uniref:hypothetical protein n=1 Tax=uncultured Corynebacterium sp. TaxID=159447 RepID=UPI0025EE6CD1|nr:hypothetical protein [uncultured Corynebacterium sp.]
MSRRIFSVVAVIGMVAAQVNAGRWVGLENSTLLAWAAFAVLLLLQIWPLQGTLRGNYGQPQHPVNRFYMWLSALGIVGTILLFLIAWATPSPLLVAIAASAMFIGVMGAAVLALFATPWREWYMRQR